ncbi:Acyl-CoA thioesterase 2 [Nostocoides japonicum T1-X7]|uniref:Acyl-CoA thioesterase 2 n=1 Tax=Nostocoides japonicum T1-X7 TaxID=1194083 RepID=A0A077LZA9_9MICO|nr:acyl-CoA thioesterase II [Tetrasphaera japonica]CCH77304.1 Acyl-CoA thioesterase 2 [Tetrasphaera japonica T1-X7]
MPNDPAASDDARAHVDRLLALLDLEELGSAEVTISSAPDPESRLGDFTTTVFLGQSHKTPHGRIFGGQVLAQCVIAAGRTVTPAPDEPARPIHSLHGYFMRPGDDRMPIRFSVEQMMDGRSFSTRRVHAIQYGRPILSMSASFQVPATGGLDHQDDMPEVPAPESLTPLTEAFAGRPDDPRSSYVAQRAVDLRHVEGHVSYARPDVERTAHQHVWMRAIASLPDDPLLHAAVLTYASDYGMLEPSIRRHGLAFDDRRLRVASLDHAMWFHRPVRMDEWVLFDLVSPSAQGGRSLGQAGVYSADGRRVATVIQEGMTRVKDA